MAIQTYSNIQSSTLSFNQSYLLFILILQSTNHFSVHPSCPDLPTLQPSTNLDHWSAIRRIPVPPENKIKNRDIQGVH